MERLLKLEVTWCDTSLSISQFGVLELFVEAKFIQGCHCGDGYVAEVRVDVVDII